jgi:phosphonopyruvate decarboxylase
MTAATTTAGSPGLAPGALYQTLRSRGVDLFSGVPCSYFGGLLDAAERDARYVAAANEGVALATAAGSALGGRCCMVLTQNSGLGNLVNPLASLAATFGIGIPLLISYRGDPAGEADEPQHELAGAATEPVLDALRVPAWRLPRDLAGAGAVLDAVLGQVAEGRCAAALLAKGTIAPARPAPAAAPGPACLPPSEALAVIAGQLADELVVATTGYTSRRLFAIGDRPGNFYMQGSMGHAISIGLGLALARPDRRVVVLDGDGACLMHLGALGTVTDQSPANLTHIVLDNGGYESTGGQRVPRGARHLDQVALNLGYRNCARVASATALASELPRALRADGPVMLVVDVARDPAVPARATRSRTPAELRARFTAEARDRKEDAHVPG